MFIIQDQILYELSFFFDNISSIYIQTSKKWDIKKD